MAYTYAEAGVSVDHVKEIQKTTALRIAGTLNKKVLLPAGHYSGLVRIGKEKVAIHTDGVGTKVRVAQQLQNYDTVGIDCVAMNVNDLVCIGARPIALVDYLALQKADAKLVDEIMKGLVKGATMANVSIVGGETAIVPDLVKGIHGKGFDLSAACIGVVEGKPITGRDVQVGDVIVGLSSSGLHSNGYTLARKVLKEKKWLKEMLKPTLIYSTAVLEMLEKAHIHGMAHITGGAFSKLVRVLPKSTGVVLDGMPSPSPIFKALQEKTRLSSREMYRTFNMGIGFCVFCPESEASNVIAISRKHGIPAKVVGRVINGKGVVLEDRGRRVSLA